MSKERRDDNTVKKVACGEQRRNSASALTSQKLTVKWNRSLILLQWAMGLMLLSGVLADFAYRFFSIGESVSFKNYAALMVLLFLVLLLKCILQRLDAIVEVLDAMNSSQDGQTDTDSRDD